MDVERDRDEQGRPRNARPRDALGRPLPRQLDTAGPGADPVFVSAGETLERAQELLDAGRPFHAHEVFEAAWKAAPDDDRDLWQGLAQLAVGITHAARGNLAGAITLLGRAGERLDQDRPGWSIVDLAGLRRWIEESTARLHVSSDAVVLTAPRLRQR